MLLIVDIDAILVVGRKYLRLRGAFGRVTTGMLNRCLVGPLDLLHLVCIVRVVMVKTDVVVGNATQLGSYPLTLLVLLIELL